MPSRYTCIRTVDPNDNPSEKTVVQLFNLKRAALAAAEETIQGSPLVNSWLRLFQDHLSKRDKVWLQWKGDLAVSTDMRRAYSALYGRYFARGFLVQKFGFEDFVSLERVSTALKNGVIVKRTKKGDIPDWIAWDPCNKSYVLVEAKGVLRGKAREFLDDRPSCIEVGKNQFQRVSVKDPNNRLIRTRNWVAANLWSTDDDPNPPVSLLWDPEGYGDDLSGDEIQKHRVAIRKFRMEKLATGMGFSIQPNGEILGLNVQVFVKPKHERTPPPPELDLVMDVRKYGHEVDIVSSEPHKGCYFTSLITPMGIRPIVTKSDLEEVKAVQVKAQKEDRAAMIYGLSAKVLSEPESSQEFWLSSNGIVSTDGAGLFNLSDVEFE